ncbi:translesion error-prone DNA polymerase V autoproteolytic subunit [Marinobacterium stanieri]|uniref:translesion error-prone DNA polymerase V autoproteolytic subunit n=1 Tax=Marinobacterium stanieri TaxID=49186 RepID=UPI003A911CAD
MTAVILARASTHTSLSIPLFMERVQAGFPSPAQDYVEQTLDLNDLCIHHPAATYFVRAEGDSMIEVGIFSGDILVVDSSLSPRHGDIVIASLNGEFTVKQLELKPHTRLLPRNPAYRPIRLPEDCELDVFGVVTNVIHSLRRPDR